MKNFNNKTAPIKIEISLKNNYLEQMIKLDDENYSSANAGVFNTCMAWYKKNPDIYIIAVRGNVVLGICILMSIIVSPSERGCETTKILTQHLKNRINELKKTIH